MFASGDSLVCFFALFPKAKCLSLCLTNSPWHIPPIHLTTNTSQKELIPRTAVQREFAREETIGHFQYYNFLVSCLLCKVVLRSLKKFVLCRSNQANTKEMKEETGYVCRAADVISWGMGRASKHSESHSPELHIQTSLKLLCSQDPLRAPLVKKWILWDEEILWSDLWPLHSVCTAVAVSPAAHSCDPHRFTARTT